MFRRDFFHALLAGLVSGTTVALGGRPKQTPRRCPDGGCAENCPECRRIRAALTLAAREIDRLTCSTYKGFPMVIEETTLPAPPG